MDWVENWDLQINSSVRKTIKKLPPRDILAVWRVLNFLPADPYFGDVQKIHGRNDVWRRRIGSYRLFYKLEIKKKLILVFHLERRGSTTY